MTEQKNNLAKLFADCWKDPDLKARFTSEPNIVLSEYGMDVPDGLNVSVVENTDNTVHITIPMPVEDPSSLSDLELARAAGGDVNTFISVIGEILGARSCDLC